jgi:hypothetical protein
MGIPAKLDYARIRTEETCHSGRVARSVRAASASTGLEK